MSQQRYTPEFKRDAVALVTREGKTVSEVGRNLGIARSLLKRWIEPSRDQDRDGKPRKTQAGETEEVRQGRDRRLCRLEAVVMHAAFSLRRNDRVTSLSLELIHLCRSRIRHWPRVRESLLLHIVERPPHSDFYFAIA